MKTEKTLLGAHACSVYGLHGCAASAVQASEAGCMTGCVVAARKADACRKSHFGWSSVATLSRCVADLSRRVLLTCRQQQLLQKAGVLEKGSNTPYQAQLMRNIARSSSCCVLLGFVMLVRKSCRLIGSSALLHTLEGCSHMCSAQLSRVTMLWLHVCSSVGAVP